jgi:hypothetical protein
VRAAELNSFADLLVSVAEADLAADITLGGRLVLSRSGELTVRNVSTILRQPSVEFKLGCLAFSAVD